MLHRMTGRSTRIKISNGTIKGRLPGSATENKKPRQSISPTDWRGFAVYRGMANRISVYGNDFAGYCAREAFTWACLQAKAWGWKWSTDPVENMIWVQTGENEIGCDDTRDFVRFVSDENQKRRKA
jgi:hypothetical protein